MLIAVSFVFPAQNQYLLQVIILEEVVEVVFTSKGTYFFLHATLGFASEV